MQLAAGALAPCFFGVLREGPEQFYPVSVFQDGRGFDSFSKPSKNGMRFPQARRPDRISRCRTLFQLYRDDALALRERPDDLNPQFHY